MPASATITLDRFTRCVLLALTVLLAIIAVELWVLRPSDLPTAHAQIPDTGLQRKQIVDEGQRSNELLERILNHLETKPIRVKVIADDKGGAARSGPRGAQVTGLAMIGGKTMHARRGFTFVEMMMAVVVIAIIVVVSWPDEDTAARESGRLAALKFEEDISFARSYSLARPDDPAVIKFDGENDRYWIGTRNQPDTPIEHPQSGKPYVVQLGPSGKPGMETVAIFAMECGGDELIVFDGTGTIDQDTEAVLQFESCGVPYEVSVKPSSGSCTVSTAYSKVLSPIVKVLKPVLDPGDLDDGESGDEELLKLGGGGQMQLLK